MRKDCSNFGVVSFFCQKGAKWCQNGQWRAPNSHFLTHPDCLRHMYMLCMIGSGNGASKRKANLPYLGGFSGGYNQFSSVLNNAEFCPMTIQAFLRSLPPMSSVTLRQVGVVIGRVPKLCNCRTGCAVPANSS